MQQAHYIQNIACRVRKINNMVYLFGEGECFELNELGNLIWVSLEKEKTLNEIVDIIEKEFDADRGTIENDASAFIQQMLEANMIISNAS